MKKIFTSLLMVVGIYSLTQAQSKKPLEFGISAGINASYVTSSAQNSVSPGLIWAPNFAVSAEHAISEEWGIKAKIIYDKKGWGDGFYVSGGKTVTGVYYALDYITIPIAATVHFGQENNWYANAGPYVGFLLSANENYANTDLKSSFNSLDVGAAGGLGIQFPLANKFKIFFEFEGQLGFSNILVNLTSYSDGAQNFRSAFNLGLKF
ncbi:MAG: PorT family protein [Mucilaginibacter sp.]|nr:PorT family protein [Mucilaginibacter sp.]